MSVESKINVDIKPEKRTYKKRAVWSWKDVKYLPEPDKEKNDPIIEVILALNKASGATDDAIAAGSGVSVQTLKKWGDGKVKRPQLHTIRCVLRFHGLDMKLFMLSDMCND